jgi:hypothetical protein
VGSGTGFGFGLAFGAELKNPACIPPNVAFLGAGLGTGLAASTIGAFF